MYRILIVIFDALDGVLRWPGERRPFDKKPGDSVR